MAGAFFAAAFFAAGASPSASACFAEAAFFAGDFAAFFALAFTVVRPLPAAAATFLRARESSALTTTATPSSLRKRTSALKCWGEMFARSVAPRNASAVTCPVDLPLSTNATTSGWARTAAGSLRDVLVDTNYLSYSECRARQSPYTSRAAFPL